MENNYLIANLNVNIKYNYEFTSKFMEPFKINFEKDKPCDIKIKITKKEVRQYYLLKKEFPEYFYENLCILKKLSDSIACNFNGFLFHASTIEYKGKAYAFSANSGVGKSTHTALLKNLLQDEVKYINDDKPFIRYISAENRIYAYGNPWRGKEQRGTKRQAPLSAICFIERATINSISVLSPKEALPKMLAQIEFPLSIQGSNLILDVINFILENLPIYLLKCNKDISAAKLSYEKILETDKIKN